MPDVSTSWLGSGPWSWGAPYWAHSKQEAGSGAAPSWSAGWEPSAAASPGRAPGGPPSPSISGDTGSVVGSEEHARTVTSSSRQGPTTRLMDGRYYGVAGAQARVSYPRKKCTK